MAAEGTPSLSELIHRGDLDELVRTVDVLASREAWEELFGLRERCHAAAEELGKQLWGAAQYAEYRIALDAPGALAAHVVTPGAARFALGPLTEVLAQHHGFDEVAEQLDAPVAPVVAQERVLRGEDLRAHPLAGEQDTGLPGVLQPWEPAYALPTYRASERIDGGPPLTPLGPPLAAQGPPGRPRSEPEVERALVELVAPWEASSAGEIHVVTVDGDATAAVTAVVAERSVLQPVGLPSAFAAMAWAAASGGAHGRRRGGAAGREAAWWVAHAVTGLAFPADPDELEFHLEELDWYLVADAAADGDATDLAAGGGARTGWYLRLAVAHPDEGWAAAIDAHDPPPTEDTEDG